LPIVTVKVEVYMNDPNEEFERALAEIAEAVKVLDSRGFAHSLPEYTNYDGLRIVEDPSNAGAHTAPSGSEIAA